MARVRPFHGTRYTVPDLGPVVSPPYDVIPEEALPGYRERSPYNVVRLIRPGTDYTGAAALERSWLESGILREDAEPAFYLHEHRFEGSRRRGVIAAVRLSAYSEGEVLPHERTHGGAKADRLELYRATATAFEPLWFVYRGSATDLPRLLDAGFAAQPTSTFRTEDGGEHRISIVADPAWQAEVTRAFAELPLLIADGHHRYETARVYAEEIGGGGQPYEVYLQVVEEIAHLHHGLGQRRLVVHREDAQLALRRRPGRRVGGGGRRYLDRHIGRG